MAFNTRHVEVVTEPLRGFTTEMKRKAVGKKVANINKYVRGQTTKDLFYHPEEPPERAIQRCFSRYDSPAAIYFGQSYWSGPLRNTTVRWV